MPTVGETSYVTLAEAEAYMASRTDSDAWDGLTEPEREAALVTAARVLDSHRWKGRRVEREQPMAWPRTGTTYDGWDVPSNEVPEVVRRAQMELAAEVAAGEFMAPDELARFSRARVGPIEVDLRDQATQADTPSYIRRMLRDLLRGGGAVVEVHLA